MKYYLWFSKFIAIRIGKPNLFLRILIKLCGMKIEKSDLYGWILYVISDTEQPTDKYLLVQDDKGTFLTPKESK